MTLHQSDSHIYFFWKNEMIDLNKYCSFLEQSKSVFDKCLKLF